MFNFLDEIIQQYFYCVMGKFGKIWNALNECGVLKNNLKDYITNVICYLKHFQKVLRSDLKMTFL
jgi:hypothetical protein